MKQTCSYCGEKFTDEEGSIKAGKFICVDCLESGAAEEEEFAECHDCGEPSEEYEKEGVCPHCGAERESVEGVGETGAEEEEGSA